MLEKSYSSKLRSVMTRDIWPVLVMDTVDDRALFISLHQHLAARLYAPPIMITSLQVKVVWIYCNDNNAIPVIVHPFPLADSLHVACPGV